MRIFGAKIDKALGRTNGYTRNRHTFNEGEGIAFHQHPVGKRAAIAFVRVADNIFLIGFGTQNGFPFDARREACTTTAAKA